MTLSSVRVETEQFECGRFLAGECTVARRFSGSVTDEWGLVPGFVSRRSLGIQSGYEVSFQVLTVDSLSVRQWIR